MTRIGRSADKARPKNDGTKKITQFFFCFLCSQNSPLVALALRLVGVRLVALVALVDAVVREVHVLVAQALHRVGIPAEHTRK